jgi:hypothetical protein
MVFVEPVPAMVKKARLNSTLLALLPASKIHEGFMPNEPTIPGIYIHSGRSPLRQVVSSSNQTNHVMTGDARWQIDTLSSESSSNANKLARVCCEALMPSIPTAGLFVINYEERDTNWDTGYLCYRSTFRIECPYREWITG